MSRACYVVRLHTPPGDRFLATDEGTAHVFMRKDEAISAGFQWRLRTSRAAPEWHTTAWVDNTYEILKVPCPLRYEKGVFGAPRSRSSAPRAGRRRRIAGSICARGCK